MPTPAGNEPPTMNHRATCLSDSRPDRGTRIRIIRVNGNNRRPAATGEYPSTFCRYKVKKKVTPNRAKNTVAATMFEAVKVGIFQNDSGSMGDGRLDSTMKKVSNRMADRTNEPRMTPAGQPFALTSNRA